MADQAVLWFLFLLNGTVSFSISASNICIGVLFLLAGYQFFILHRSIIHTPLDRSISIYILIVLVAGLVGLSPTKTLLHLDELWHIALYLMVVNWVPNRTLAMRLVGVLLSVGALHGLYGIAQHVSGGLDLFQFEGYERIKWVDDQVRATGVFSHYMTYSGQMLLLGLFGMGLLLFWARGWVFWLLGFAELLLIGGILSSLTRNALLGFVAGFLVIGALKGRKTFSMITVMLTLSIVFALVIHTGFRSRVMNMVNVTTDESNLERIRMWRTTIDVIEDHRLLGVGMGNYKTAMNQYRHQYGSKPHSHAHNTLLQQTAENGLIGLVAYLFVWYVFFRKMIPRALTVPDPFARGVITGGIGALVGFHVAGLFEYNLGDIEVAMMMWLIVGFTMAAAQGRLGEESQYENS